ncbi:MAG: hypothetical protein ACSHYF_08425 [Verrucomicrobiaceae bacterium]
MISETAITACATCANAFKHSEGNAAGWAILVMLIMIVPLALGSLFFIVRMARREKAGLDARYMDDYVPPVQNS